MVHISISVLNSMHMFICCFCFCASLVLQMVVCVLPISPLNKVVITSCCNTLYYHAASDNMVELKARGTEATVGTYS